MQRVIKWVLGLLGAVAFLCGGFVILHGSLQPASINAWLPAGNLAAARAGAASVLLQDGRLLITGGNGGASALATTDILDPSSGFTAGPPMSIARSNHVAVLLEDDRVLVAGGTDASGRASQSAELYDPAANSWSASGPLMVGRSGATATLLPSGQVLIAGGTANGAALNSLELFDPNSNTFSLVSGTLSSARENHAAALLPDGRVLIAGGWDGSTLAPVPPATTGTPKVLASTDIFDPSTGAVAPGPALTSPRMNFTATTALDGSIVAIGGTDGQNDLASIDVLISGAGAFALSGAQLTTARQGHQAFLLPHNGNILVVGGTSNGAAISSAELYTPWTGATSVTGAMASARSSATGSPLFQTVLTAPVGIDGALIVAGGQDASSPPATLQSAEVYGFATIKTDKADYQPGDTINISGSGWMPGEVVQMSLVEVPDLDGDSPIALTATADASGNFSNVTFPINVADLNVHFTLTAVGGASQAQTTFTDSVSFQIGSVTVLGAQDPNPVLAGNNAQYGADAAHSIAVTFNANGGGSGTTSCTANLSVSAGLPSGATAAFSPSSLTTSGSSDQTLHTLLTINTASTTPAGTYTITVTAAKGAGCNGNDATTTATLVVVAPQLVFTNAPFSAIAGQCSAVTVERQDSSGTPTTTGSQVVNLSTTSGGGGFYSNNTCTSGVSSTTITNGNSDSTVYYKDSLDGNPTLTASASGFTSGTQNETINLQLAFTSSAFTVNTGVCSPLITLQSQNYAATLTAPSANRILSLSSSSGGGTFYSNSTCTTSITTTVLNHSGAGAGTASFYYKDTTAGSPMVSVSGTLLVSTMQTETINSANVATTTTVSSSVNPSVFGESVTFTAVVSPNSGTNTPTGTIAFVIDGGGSVAGTPATCPVTAPANSLCATTSTSTLTVNGGVAHTVSANYTHTGSFSDSSGSLSGGQTVGQADTTTTVTLTSGSSPSLVGDSLTFQAAVAAVSPGGGTPAGNVTFYDGGTCSSPGTLLSGPTALNGSGLASFSTSSLTHGTHTILACYAGNSNYNASSNTLSQTVDYRATSTTVTSISPGSVPLGVGATVTVTVKDTSPGTASNPGGTVTLTTSGSGTFGTCTLAPSGSDSATCTASYTPSGTVSDTSRTDTIKASFTASDSTHENSSDATGMPLTVTKRSTSTTVTSLTPNSVVVAQSTTVRVTVVDTESGTVSDPGGTVSLASTGAGTFGTCTLAQGVNPTGTMSCDVSYTPSSAAVSPQTITASFTATDSVHKDSADTTGKSLTVTRRTTSTGVAFGTNTVVTGQSTSVTVTVTDTQAEGTVQYPTGTITLVSSESTDVFTGTCMLASTVTAGVSSCSVSVKPVHVATSPHTITASFSQTDVHLASSGHSDLTVNRDATTTALTSSANPTTLGQSVSFTATVTANAPGSGTPTGNVQFYIDGVAFGSPVTLSIGSATSGSTTTLTAGPHNITAAYGGDSDYLASDNTASPFVENVNYNFLGLFDPYAPPGVRGYKVNSAIPLKWQYADINNTVVNSSNANPVVQIYPAAGCGDTSTGTILDIVASGNSGYQYDTTTNTWQFNWKTGGSIGAGCYVIYIKSNLTGQTNGPFPIQLVR
jgi:Bacterial Ig-like domain (group 3)/Galactose oxidase, central domain